MAAFLALLSFVLPEVKAPRSEEGVFGKSGHLHEEVFYPKGAEHPWERIGTGQGSLALHIARLRKNLFGSSAGGAEGQGSAENCPQGWA